LNILIASDVFFPDGHGGGARVPWEIATGLAGRGHSIYYLTRRSSDQPSHQTINGINLIRYEWNSGFFIRSIMEARAYLREIKNPIDVIHLHSPFTGLVLFKQPIGTNVPTFYFFHSPWAEEYEIRQCFYKRSIFFYKPKSIIRSFIEKILIKNSQCILILSEFMEIRYLRLYKNLQKKIIRISGAVDIQKFNPKYTPLQARKKLGWPINSIHLLTVRNLEARMGLENLLSALSTLKKKYSEKLHLTLIGDGTLHYYLKDLTKQLNLESCVTFLGKVSDDILAKCYLAADMFVLPTRELEGFGLVTVEALASGCPVVATPVGGTIEILKPFDNSLLARGTEPDDISMVIENLLERRSEWPELRRKCTQYARSNYSWDSIVNIIEESNIQLL
jgi:glycosyltransferase involved in cell wall biosynthesis